MQVDDAKIPTSWSFSRWDTWRTCPLKYRLQFIDKLPTAQSPAMARGNKIHLQLAAYIEGKSVPLPPEVKHPEHVIAYDFMRTFPGTKVVEQQWGFDVEWKDTGYFAKNIWLRSILDVALFYEDQTVEIVDHKTGKRYGSNDDQVELFALTAMTRYRTSTAVTTRLIYVDSGDQQLADWSAKDRAKLQAKWTDLVRPMFGDRQWPARPNDKCHFCDFGASKGGSCRFG
jgi:RecB family exonuclease